MTQNRKLISGSPETTFEIGVSIGRTLCGGDTVLLYGGLGAGKTLITKGILSALDYDVDEVTSPSFSLVNLYKTEKFDVYHLDLWRLEGSNDVPAAVGLDDILESGNAIAIIEWADHLTSFNYGCRVITITISGEGSDSRVIEISLSEGSTPEDSSIRQAVK